MVDRVASIPFESLRLSGHRLRLLNKGATPSIHLRNPWGPYSMPPGIAAGHIPRAVPGFKSRCRLLIAEVCELERDWKVFRPHRGNHRLKFVPAFAGHADLLVLNLGGYFEFRLADIADDLFGNIGRNTLFDLNQLPRMPQRRNVRLALLDAFEADIAFGNLADDNLHQRLQLERVVGGEFDLVFFEHDFRRGPFEIETVGQFFPGHIHGVLDFHRVDLADDIE